jgi:hypothetical protein
VSTRRRAVRLPEGDLPAIVGGGTSKSAASRRFVELSAERLSGAVVYSWSLLFAVSSPLSGRNSTYRPVQFLPTQLYLLAHFWQRY